MNCPVCKRELAPTLSICFACGAMVNDTVREELETKIVRPPATVQRSEIPKFEPVLPWSPEPVKIESRPVINEPLPVDVEPKFAFEGPKPVKLETMPVLSQPKPIVAE